MQRCGRRVTGRGNGMYKGTDGNWIGKFQEEQKSSGEWRGVGGGREVGDEYSKESRGQSCVGPCTPW